MEKVPMTKQGFDRLSAELENLKKVERPAIIQAIAEAREHGDLKENAEYHAAREKQSFAEGRIAELEDKLSRAEVIDPSQFTGPQVKFGATITVVDEDSDEEMTYQIVGPDEGDIDNGKLSLSAPLSRAVIGKSVGESVEVNTPKGAKAYEILDVKYG